MFTMYNVYRRISKQSFNGKKVLSRKTKVNSCEIDIFTVGEWFKQFAKNLKDNYDVRGMATTALNLNISILTEDGRNLIYEYWAEATK